MIQIISSRGVVTYRGHDPSTVESTLPVAVVSPRVDGSVCAQEHEVIVGAGTQG